MARIVQKYGGTSVGDIERIKRVANRIKAARDEGNEVVVVVSARSGVTNELIARAKAIHEHPSERELDMLLATGEQETIALTAIAMQAVDVDAVSYTGGQAGIFTDAAHTKAKIKTINASPIIHDLLAGKVVIVAGFQGINEEGQITTLGRGGSDLTAIALAAAVKADKCEIYTDVDGVYTADPRVVKDARKLNEISYDEMLELASSGSKVMQSRSVEFAKKYDVVFEVRSSFNHNPGTIVKEEVAYMEQVVVRGVAVDKDQTKVIVSNIPDKPGSAGRVFRALADANIIVDMIVQNIGRNGIANLTFTVPQSDSHRARQALDPVFKEIGGGEVAIHDQIAKLSVVGVGMKTHSGVAATLFETLAAQGINIELISTSEIKISVVIAAAAPTTPPAPRTRRSGWTSSEPGSRTMGFGLRFGGTPDPAVLTCCLLTSAWSDLCFRLPCASSPPAGRRTARLLRGGGGRPRPGRRPVPARDPAGSVGGTGALSRVWATRTSATNSSAGSRPISSPALLKELVARSYRRFSHPAIAPLEQLGENLFVLELFHGPTLAFKDFALQLLGNLYEHQCRVRGETINVLGATSGDTGAAAIHGLLGKPGVAIFILYPDGADRAAAGAPDGVHRARPTFLPSPSTERLTTRRRR